MSTESAFNKRLRPETAFDKFEALLEHLNLPQKFIDFIRKNRKILAVLSLVLLVGIVAASFYGSYREEQVKKAVAMLSAASEKKGVDRIAALEKVASDFPSTSSATWAKVEIAQQWMENREYQKAAQQYSSLMENVKSGNPLYSLLLLGKAGALEGAKSWDEAVYQYDTLQDIVGYESLGYLGAARVYRQQGKEEKALAVCNNFLLKAGDDPRLQADKQEVEAEIARIKMIIENKK